MAMLFMEAIGPQGEELATAASEATGIPVGIDPEFGGATFDSDDHQTEAVLEAAVAAALEEIDPDWHTQLRVAAE